MTKKPELLNCPFCGGKAKREYLSDNLIDMVVCCKCTTGVLGTNKESAIDAWNKRAYLKDKIVISKEKLEKLTIWLRNINMYEDLSMGGTRTIGDCIKMVENFKKHLGVE